MLQPCLSIFCWGIEVIFLLTPCGFLSFQVSMVSRLKHDNFVQLLGYCVDGNSRILAYEFASNGSLHDILHGIWFFLSVGQV